MQTDAARALLRALNAQNVSVVENRVTASCPLAPWTHAKGTDSRPSFAIICKEGDATFYNCYACGGGDLLDLVQLMVRHGAKSPQYDIRTALKIAAAAADEPLAFNVKDFGAPPPEPWITFPEPWLATFTKVRDVPRALKYLRRRDVPDRVSNDLDLRYDSEIDAVAFPIRDFEGRLCGLRARRIAPLDDEPRYHIYKDADGNKNMKCWYGEHWIDFDKAIVMCESVFDVASVRRIYSNVCAPMSASFSKEKAKRMRAAQAIVTFFDNDKAGDKARERVDKYFPRAYVWHAFPPEGSDPGEMSAAEIRDALKKHVKLTGEVK